jgi:hypothetical protein
MEFYATIFLGRVCSVGDKVDALGMSFCTPKEQHQ